MLHDGGRFLGWSRREPSSIAADGRNLSFEYDVRSGRMELDVPGEGPVELRIALR